MSSITNINNNSYVTNIGRTTPVSPGQAPASRSIPVVLATDQSPVPVEEQNKVQSEVALSLLGIPRAEVALGIFADVNTYDVNPSEWSFSPQAYVFGHGTKHLPNEAGALVEAPRNETAVLTSKRFFRYQPGRVSAATFGIKSTTSISEHALNPQVRKYGIFDNLDGYYWETRQNGQGDNFAVVRRTQSLFYNPATPFGDAGSTGLRGSNTSELVKVTQNDDYRIVGKAPNSTRTSPNNLAKDRAAILANKFAVVEDAYATTEANYASGQTITYVAGGTFTGSGDFYEDLAQSIYGAGFTTANVDTVRAKCTRDGLLWVDRILNDLEWGGDGHVKVNVTNFNVALIANGSIFEAPFYGYLEAEINGLADVIAADSKVTALINIIEAFYNNGTVPDVSVGETDSTWGSKGKLDTIFDVKGLYWGYLATEYKANGSSAQYFAADDTSQTTPITDLTTVIYSSGDHDFTLAEVKSKCQRDTNYLIQGIKNDIVGGGNAETKYNMSMYMKANGMAIASQALVEIDRQTGTKARVLNELQNNFGYATTSSAYLKTTELFDLILANFEQEDTNAMELGERGFAGNLITLRDGLLMVHAGVFDPSLLKEKEQILALPTASTNTFTLSKGEVTFGQHVRLMTQLNANLNAGQIYKVYATDGFGTTFTLQDDDGDIITFTDSDINAADPIYFETVVPFIFPNTYDPDNLSTLFPAQDTSGFPTGMMFPYMYASDQNLVTNDPSSLKLGYVNTTSTSINTIRTQIDTVNFIPEYINWIKNNVKPEYYSVYEYRVPRSRFSHDTLDGKSELAAAADASYTPPFRVYSDKATGEGGIVRPGEIVVENGISQKATSEYEFDFGKVSMLKIEFSWYGAVGALFLAYVPIDNGEARWVRVHHLRASNQLKIPSLGNATLPITYNVYGGGDSLSKGDGEEEGGAGDTTGIDQGYGNDSHNIVKYGASYYIDGGDRGTVRLYSHNNDLTEEAYGKQWTISPSAYSSGDLSLTINAANVSEVAYDIDPVFFMGARLKTGNKTDQNIRVIWADATKVYLSAAPQNTTSIQLLTDRANVAYGLETKERILSTLEGNSIRNRVQVYPTKLSTSNLGNNPIRLRMKKTPIFQTTTTASGTIQINDTYRVTSENLPLPITESATYLQNGESVFGWFQAVLDEAELITVFGRLYKAGDSYYFELRETYSGVVELRVGFFLKDERFDAGGNTLTSTTKSEFEKEGLSSVKVATDTQVPIPGTGINIATLYLTSGSEQLDLLSYFDYNKEYLSFPLTNIPDTLYFAIDQDNPYDVNTNELISLGVTWEEQ